MMHFNLNISTMLERAEKFYPGKQIISRTLHQTHHLSYREMGERTRRLSSVLSALGVEIGDRVGTFGTNHHRHLEAYFAIPGLGAIVHTINIRLSSEHLVNMINHAEDKVLLIDEDLLPRIEKIKERLPLVKAYILMSDSKDLPVSTLEPLYSYEALLEKGDPAFQFVKDLDEYSPAGLCYTFSTSGKLKGVIYTHRAIVLHSLVIGLGESLALTEADVCMPIVPMFHVNAWGLPYAATWFGATQVLPGPHFTSEILADLISREKVTVSASVPTVWLGLLVVLEQGSHDVSSLRAVVSGGSAVPMSLIAAYDKLGVPLYQAYGMTETAPVVTVSRLKSYQEELPLEERILLRAKQGVLVPGLEMKIVSSGGEVKWDGKEMGELLLRGPWIANEYYKDDDASGVFKDGWLHTGDIATIDKEGFIQLKDRTKDLIKSGGEWISAIELENAILELEEVLEAAVVPVPSEIWGERPIACVVLKDKYAGKVGQGDILERISAKFPNWWLPDEVVFMDELPRTMGGKFLKEKLKEEIKKHI